MHGKRTEQRVRAFSQYVKETTNRKRISKKIRYEPAPIKIIYRDGTIEYKNQTKSEVIDTILKGARKRK